MMPENWGIGELGNRGKLQDRTYAEYTDEHPRIHAYQNRVMSDDRDELIATYIAGGTGLLLSDFAGVEVVPRYPGIPHSSF